MSDLLSKAALDGLVAAELAKDSSRPAVTAQAPPKGVSKWAQIATLAGNAADAGSTIYALNKGAMEGNPLYGENPSTGKVLGVKAGSTAVQMLLNHFLGKKSPAAANALGYGQGALFGGIAGWNMSQAAKMKK